MAKVRQRTWRVPGQRGKRKAWGFVTTEDGKQVRHFKTEWSKGDAENALAQYLLKVEQKPDVEPSRVTLKSAVEQYLKTKARKKSLAFDKLYLTQLQSAFGADTPLAEITAAHISAWKADKLATVCDRTGKPYAAATINRPLSALRHLLQLAHEEWGILTAVPKIRLEKEPEGRIRWLEPEEESRLLAACSKSKNPELAKVVTVALETGLRRGELLGLTWDRVDLSRGVIRLEVTKAGRRREVPMRQKVYEVLAGLTGDREGCVFRTRSVRTAFENAVAEAKLDDFHFHDCRHHFASMFVMRGGSLQALKEILGHATLAMTMRYAHLAPEHLRSEVEKTERRAQPAEQPSDKITQEITQEVRERELVSRN